MKRSSEILFLKQWCLSFLEQSILYGDDIEMTFLAILKVDMQQMMRRET